MGTLRKCRQASSPSLCGMLVYKEETSSVTRIAFSGRGAEILQLEKKVGRVFDVGWQCLYKRLQVIINKFRDAFSRVTIV